METRVTHSKKTTAPDGASLLNDYYNEDELAAEIRRSPRTIARWRAIGEGPRFIILGREILYRKAAVRDWLAGLEQEPE
jgi:hypothetical protein